jgi:hypothetical protein
VSGIVLIMTLRRLKDRGATFFLLSGQGLGYARYVDLVHRIHNLPIGSWKSLPHDADLASLDDNTKESSPHSLLVSAATR